MSKVEFIRKPWSMELDPRKKGYNYKIENIVTLEPKLFEEFLADPQKDYDFIKDNSERMYTDKNGIWHCILITAEGYNFGILVQSEGYSYARYAASIPRSEFEEEIR